MFNLKKYPWCLLLPLHLVSCSNKQKIFYADKTFCINNSESAISKAEKEWLGVYGKAIYSKKPFIAELKSDTIWIVKGSLPQWKDGGVPYAEINARTCVFIKVSHSK